MNWRGHLNTSIPLICDMAPLSGVDGKDTLAPPGTIAANTVNHDGKGQNVLYGDGHVDFQFNAFAAGGQDNIFTVGPVSSQQPVTTFGVVPGTSDFVMVPVRDAGTGNLGQ